MTTTPARDCLENLAQLLINDFLLRNYLQFISSPKSALDPTMLNTKHGEFRVDNIQGTVSGKACYSVDEFCSAHAISRAMFYKLRNEGKAPRTMSVGTRTLISFEAAADWRRQCESENAA